MKLLVPGVIWRVLTFISSNINNNNIIIIIITNSESRDA